MSDEQLSRILDGAYSNRRPFVHTLFTKACLKVARLAGPGLAGGSVAIAKQAGVLRGPLTGKQATAVCVIAAIVMLFAWTPLLLAGFPGYFAYDAGTGYLMQWAQIESGELNAHHPVLHTVFLGVTVSVGKTLFGSFNAGICFSVLIQAILVAAGLAAFIRLLISLGLNKRGFLLSLAYFCLDPIIGLFALCTTKDVLFSVAVVTYCALVVFGYRRWEGASRNLKKQILCCLIILGFFICSLRANGFAALILAVPIIAMLLKKRFARCYVICMVVSLALSAAWLGPMSMVLGVEASPIGKWNAFSIPMQQIARCYADGNVEAIDKQTIEDSLGAVPYKENLSDIARSAFIQYGGELLDLAKLYLELGMKYPVVYTQAFLAHTEDAWSPFAVIDAYQEPDDNTTSVFEFVTKEPGTMDSKISWLADFLSWLSSQRGIESIPVFGLVVSISFYVYVLIICVVISIIRRDKIALCFLILPTLLTLSNIFGPCMLIRYFLYLFYGLPALVYFLFHPYVDRTLYSN